MDPNLPSTIHRCDLLNPLKYTVEVTSFPVGAVDERSWERGCCRSRDRYNGDFFLVLGTIFKLAKPVFIVPMRKIYIGQSTCYIVATN